MKKITLTLLGLVAFSTSALAQQEVKFGPKAGVNFANVSGKFFDAEYQEDQLEFDKGQTGFHIGAFAEIKFNDKFAIQPEVLYSVQGGKYKQYEKGTDIIFGMPIDYEIDGEMKWNLHYINVPIMAKYYIIPSLAIEAGPYVGFNIKSEWKSEYKSSLTFQGETELSSGKETEDIKNGTNSVDFGLGAGASFNLNNGFFVEARYNLGLSKVGKDFTFVQTDEEGERYETHLKTDNVKNGVIQVSIGYKF
ncbi:Outer membrane protein beta-barrel domain-containing protein [Paenimyroides aquimaris]|uniref:Outer membrane protein beta-barrel domain-containing protein n=1 Tax=Paenimyroides marinum TaxID=1159016 RepID=A0A1H6KN17_9FLAO|nr:porin family protein [Paenimyroides aquimaris]SEH74844.1 Outer membrane protein beta-barrel domain-containing protein [Paenimyroides aquimaris]